MTHRRILLGALFGAATIAAVPSAASATASCTYNPTTRTMDVRMAAADTNITVSNGLTLRFGKGGESFRSCISPTGTQATAANTDSVVIRAASGTGAATQTTTIDETNGDFSDSNAKLHFTVLTGTGGDRLIVKEGAGAQFVTLRDQGGLGIGPAIDLDADRDDDILMTSTNAVVQVNGGAGKDILDAGPAGSYQVVLLGEGENDTLRGGKRGGDFLDGGVGSDRIFAEDGQIDTVRGGKGVGTDHATVDFNPHDDVADVANVD